MQALRIYTIRNQAMADLYYHVHWQRHLISLPKYRIQVDQVQLEQVKTADAPCRVFALVHTDDMATLNDQYMYSDDFKADMAGYDMTAILNVEEVELKSEMKEIH
ncbi:hypothetical protein [Lacticaseibacillus porcinae]|uniref:hypothetical protein n=1 Tax=Lacticaseibacillus porcinae TaxID=1123687 RepID=UPI000F7A1437|nr:hypothetical protein [Lacticaseibacillus porcinae]